MKNFKIEIDDSLIIPRLKQKELLFLKGSPSLHSFYPILTSAKLEPFVDNLAINMGLSLKLIGPKIINAKAERGYFRHGLCQVIKNLDFFKAINAFERINPKTPIFYQVAFLNAWHKLTGVHSEVWQFQQFAMAMEFARIAHHAHVVKKIFFILSLPDLINPINEILHLLQGYIGFYSRVHIRPETLAREMDRIEAKHAISESWHRINELEQRANNNEKINRNLAGLAHISLDHASALGLTGPYLRSNGLAYDARTKGYNPTMSKLVPEIIVNEGGDALARLQLRILEIKSSLEWLTETLIDSSHEVGKLEPILAGRDVSSLDPLKPFAISEVEGPEGVIGLGIFFNKNSKNYIYSLRSPAFYIAQAISTLLQGSKLAKLNLTLSSLGIFAEEVDL